MTDRLYSLVLLLALTVMLSIALVAAIGAQATTGPRMSERYVDIEAAVCQLDPTTCEVRR